jgi:hypothetical protein
MGAGYDCKAINIAEPFMGSQTIDGDKRAIERARIYCVAKNVASPIGDCRRRFENEARDDRIGENIMCGYHPFAIGLDPSVGLKNIEKSGGSVVSRP